MSGKFIRFEVEDKIAALHNAKPLDERKELCMHSHATAVNEIEHAKHTIQKHHDALMRELTDRQKRFVRAAEEELYELEHRAQAAYGEGKE